MRSMIKKPATIFFNYYPSTADIKVGAETVTPKDGGWPIYLYEAFRARGVIINASSHTVSAEELAAIEAGEKLALMAALAEHDMIVTFVPREFRDGIYNGIWNQNFWPALSGVDAADDAEKMPEFARGPEQVAAAKHFCHQIVENTFRNLRARSDLDLAQSYSYAILHYKDKTPHNAYKKHTDHT